jgi:outer membrane immunogenic protein
VAGFLRWGALGWIGTNPKHTTGAVVLGAPFVVSSASSKNGLSYGLLSGYNYQVGQLVLGVEGDFRGWTVGKIRYTAVTGDFLTAHSKWGGSIRGRPGYATDRALLYVTGGAAFVSDETSIPFTGISIGGDGTRWGWTVGGGLDPAITNNWFTGIEYRYSQYEAKTFVYVRGIVQGDEDDSYVIDVTGRTVRLPRGSSDAALAPYHVDRSKLFVVAADLIGQLGDPHYMRKSNALFYEFEEIGLNKKLGYETPGRRRLQVSAILLAKRRSTNSDGDTLSQCNFQRAPVDSKSL